MEKDAVFSNIFLVTRQGESWDDYPEPLMVLDSKDEAFQTIKLLVEENHKNRDEFFSYRVIAVPYKHHN